MSTGSRWFPTPSHARRPGSAPRSAGDDNTRPAAPAVLVETGAAARFDDACVAAGATVVSQEEVYASADVLLCIARQRSGLAALEDLSSTGMFAGSGH